MESEYIILGRFGRVYGLRGGIWVRSYTEPESSIVNYRPWYIHQKEGWMPVEIKNISTRPQGLIVYLAGVEDCDTVACFKNKDIGVLKESMPVLPENECYYYDLIGMLVRNTNGDLLGKLVDIMPTGSHDVMVVSGDVRRLIPYALGTYVKHVDTSRREIVVDWDLDFDT